MSQPQTDARRAARDLMTAVTAERQPLFQLEHRLEALPPGDRARALRLATGALRWAPRADKALGPFLQAKPDDALLNTLRLALYEMGEEAAPDHAVVHAAVDMTDGKGRGFVNAVLRNYLRRGKAWADLPLPGLPKWLRKRLVAAWGKEAVAAIEAAHASGAPMDLSVRSDAAGWAARLGGQLLPTGSIRLTAPGQISALEGYAEGAWWVQDAAAALPALCLAPRPGERVLDLCAAPGGKTMQLAAAGAGVTALDISAPRLKRLAENLARTGLSAETVAADALHWTPPAPFDAILVDAPCSATGTLRRHPDLAYAKDGSELDTLVPLQAALIDRAAGWLAPGGRMVYCTCSLLPEEGEAQLAAALSRHPSLSVVDVRPSGVPEAWAAPGGGLRTRPDHWPSLGGLDGFFIALLQKSA